MKIIGLLPFKNEEWILPTFLKNVLPVCDEIIAIDDNSTDNSRQIMEDAGVIVKEYQETEDIRGGWNPGRVRQYLFEYARERKGTHFLCLDADETFTTNFLPNAREIISDIKPGQKLVMQWLALWKSYDHYRDDNTVWSNLFKDFVVADSPELKYKYGFMADGRTIGPNTPENMVRLDPSQGCVLHYQFSTFNNFHLKQAWKQVGELVQHGPGAVNTILSKYSICFLDDSVGLTKIPDEWLTDIPVPPIPNFDPEWKEENYLRADLMPKIIEHFDAKGIEYFEGLRIWHIPQLRKMFVDRTGREPGQRRQQQSLFVPMSSVGFQ